MAYVDDAGLVEHSQDIRTLIDSFFYGIVAEPWNEQKVYSPGELCVYTGSLFKRTSYGQGQSGYVPNLGSTTTWVPVLVSGVYDSIEVTLPNVSDSNRTFNVNGITENHRLIQDGFAVMSNPSAAGSNLTITTGDGTVTVGGVLNGTTDIIATFCIKNVEVTGTAIV